MQQPIFDCTFMYLQDLVAVELSHEMRFNSPPIIAAFKALLVTYNLKMS